MRTDHGKYIYPLTLLTFPYAEKLIFHSIFYKEIYITFSLSTVTLKIKSQNFFNYNTVPPQPFRIPTRTPLSVNVLKPGCSLHSVPLGYGTTLNKLISK